MAEDDAEGRFAYCRLSKKAKYEKRVAVTVFSFPPDKGNVGTAAYLNVFGSIHKVLTVSCTSFTVRIVGTQECSVTAYSMEGCVFACKVAWGATGLHGMPVHSRLSSAEVPNRCLRYHMLRADSDKPCLVVLDVASAVSRICSRRATTWARFPRTRVR